MNPTAELYKDKMNKDIETIREKIDTIDKEAFQLLINRLNAVTDIGKTGKARRITYPG